MSAANSNYYFRLRDNGAAVFLIDPETRHRRIEMTQIAVINRQGDVKPHGDHVLTDADLAATEIWKTERSNILEARQLDDIFRTVDHLNLTTSWAQQKASDADLDAVTDRLLMAMHDLRQTLVRKKANRLAPKDDS